MSATLDDAAITPMVTIGNGLYSSRNSNHARAVTLSVSKSFGNVIHGNNTVRGNKTIIPKRKSSASKLKIDAMRMI